MISIECSLYSNLFFFPKACHSFFLRSLRAFCFRPRWTLRCVLCLRLRPGKRLHHAWVHAEAGEPFPDPVAAPLFLPLSEQTWVERRGRVSSKSAASPERRFPWWFCIAGKFCKISACALCVSSNLYTWDFSRSDSRTPLNQGRIWHPLKIECAIQGN